MRSIKEIVDNRDIAGLYHFTTNNGVLGVLGSGALKSRKRLPEDKLLEFIITYNANERKYDKAWLDYINLSVGRINSEFFGYCSKWHPNVWWCVLELDVELLGHEGVYFSTTNNIYPAAKRNIGAKGLEALFDEVVFGRYSQRIARPADLSKCYPTDVQAEVLYPGEIPLSYLKRIIVAEESQQDTLIIQQETLGINPKIEVDVDPTFLPDVAR